MPRITAFPSSIFWKICLTFSFLSFCLSVTVSLVVASKVKSVVENEIYSNIENQIHLLYPQVIASFKSKDFSQTQTLMSKLGQAIDRQISLIDLEGTVVVDSNRETQFLENHSNQPEIIMALNEGVGFSSRHSDTLNMPMLFFAKRVTVSGMTLGIIRIALPQMKVEEELTAVNWIIAFIAIAGMAIASVIGWILARKVTHPINEMVKVAEALRDGKYETKMTNLSHDEIGRLGEALNRLGRDLSTKLTDLKKLERIRQDFVANVSHELKTPLTSIRGYVETLKSGADEDPRYRCRFLDKIEDNAIRLSTLVQSILSLAHIESQESQLDLKSIRWNTIVESIVKNHDTEILRKQLNVKIIEKTLNLHVYGDRESMIQIVENLFTNAIKYTSAGGKITIVLDEQNHSGKLVISDSGIGIPKQHQQRIFERFYRVDKARSRELGGTGLGLSIVKHLVSAMGGVVTVKSEPGKGCTFEVLLKLSH